jgi:hypothetical protein
MKYQPPVSFDPLQYAEEGRRAGCPDDQMRNLVRGNVALQPRQLSASAAARMCDHPGGPTAIGFGGARGGGKTYWLLAQLGADDCQRYPGLKCLLLRKSARSNRENFEDACRRLFPIAESKFSASEGAIVFPNGSRIITRHYQHEKEIESLLGLEYDVIAIEEATQLTRQKWINLKTCNRTSRPGWRPRIYTTTNPGGVGHDWYLETFVLPYNNRTESATRFIPARVQDNRFMNREYEADLAKLPGSQRKMWYEGKWDVAAGQFFNTFRHDVHVLDSFDDYRGAEWFAAMDYGFAHYTVVLLACLDAEDNTIIVDEYIARFLIPDRIEQGVCAMFLSHKVLPRNRPPAPPTPPSSANGYKLWPDNYTCRPLSYFVAGGDLFSRQFDGSTLVSHFSSLGPIRPANTNRTQGWAEIQRRLGDPDAGIKPTLFIHKRCQRLLNTLPYLQHDPDQPADILKADTNDEGLGGDDAADACRYLLATKPREIFQTKLRGF